MDAIENAERLVIDAARMWRIDQECKSAQEALAEAVDDLLRLRRERRERKEAA